MTMVDDDDDDGDDGDDVTYCPSTSEQQIMMMQLG